MISEDEKWQGGSSEGTNGSREGYNKPYSAEGGKVGHTPRPRFKRVERAYGSTESGEGRAYRSSYTPNRGEGGAPRQGGYRPRYNNNENAEGRAYTPRPRYNNNGEGGGYRPRYNNGYGASQQGGGYRRDNNGGEGGYRREGNGEGGFRPRYNNNRPNGRFNNNRPQRQRTADYDPNAKYSMKKRIEYKEINYDPEEPIRLNKFLANAGVCSRREADTYIAAGVVSVNGTIVTELGVKVKRSDEIRFHDQPVSMEKKVYVLLNKPKDYVTTSDDPQNRKTVMDLVKNVCRERIYPVGRLDRNTTGVLMLTNDGDLASKLTHPKFLKKKIYHVTCDKNVSAADLNTILTGVTLEDGEIHADNVSYASPTDKKQIGIEIHSGKNRIVRRIFEHLGYRVVKLDRVLFAGLTKKNLRRGDWRFLTEAEVNMLRMGAFE